VKKIYINTIFVRVLNILSKNTFFALIFANIFRKKYKKQKILKITNASLTKSIVSTILKTTIC